MMMFGTMIEKIDVRSRDLGMEGTRRESARKYMGGVLRVNRETAGYIVRKSVRGIGRE
jgi:hypothetical protein